MVKFCLSDMWKHALLGTRVNCSALRQMSQGVRGKAFHFSWGGRFNSTGYQSSPSIGGWTWVCGGGWHPSPGSTVITDSILESNWLVVSWVTGSANVTPGEVRLRLLGRSVIIGRHRYSFERMRGGVLLSSIDRCVASSCWVEIGLQKNPVSFHRNHRNQLSSHEDGWMNMNEYGWMN